MPEAPPLNPVTPRDDEPPPPSALQNALTAAEDTEHNGVTAVWDGGENAVKTTDYSATVSNSPSLSNMLGAMDQIAQTQGVTSDLVDLRGRFVNVLAKAYGESAGEMALDGDHYMRLHNPHPGLSK